MKSPRAVLGDADRIVLEGVTTLDEAALRTSIESVPGHIEPEVVAADLRRLFETPGVADVIVLAIDQGDRRELVYRIREHLKVGMVFRSAKGPETDEEKTLMRRLREQKLVEPVVVSRFVRETRAAFKGRGHPRAEVRVTGHASEGHHDVCVHVEPGPVVTIGRWAVVGLNALDEDAQKLVWDDDGHNQKGLRLNEQALSDSLLRLQAALYDRGYLESKVSHKVDELGDDKLAVTITVEEGAVYHLGKVTVHGHALAAYRKLTKPLEPGAVFDRSVVLAVVEAIKEHHEGEHVEVTPDTRLDTTKHVVDIVIDVASPD